MYFQSRSNLEHFLSFLRHIYLDVQLSISGCPVITCTNSFILPEYHKAEIGYTKIKHYRLSPDLINSHFKFGLLQRQIPRCVQMVPALMVFDSQKHKSRLVIDMRSENSLVKILNLKLV